MKGHGTKTIKLVSTPTKNLSDTGGNAGYICYIDDSRTSAYVTKKILKEYGYKVDHFTAAEPAIVSVLEKNYDLLLTDLTLSSGGMDGDDLVRFIRKSGHPRKQLLPVIVITGTSEKDTLLRIYEAGANGVLVKPLTGEELNERIRSLVPENSREAVDYKSEQEDEIPELNVDEPAAQPVKKPKATPRTIKEETNKTKASKVNSQAEEIENSTVQESPVAKILEEPNQREESQQLFEGLENLNLEEDDDSESDEEKLLFDIESLENEYNTDEPIESPPPPIEPLSAVDPIQDKEDDLGFYGKTEPEIPQQETHRPNDAAALIAELRAKAKAEAEQDDIPVLTIDDHKHSSDAESFTPLFDSDSFNEQEEESVSNLETELLGGDGDKKIITALDINTQFAEFQDDIYRPSMMQSVLAAVKQYKILTLAALISFIIILGTLWNYFSSSGALAVETVKVGMGTLHQAISVPGKVVSKLKVDVSSSVAGQIVSVNVKEGEKVKKNQVLAELENEEAQSEVKRAEGNLLSAQEESALAEKTLKRMERALALGAVSRQQTEESQANLKSAKAKESVAREELKASKLSLEKLNVTAPFDGTVTARYAQVGQWVTPSEALFSLVDLGQREIEVKVDAADSSLISVGQSVLMSSDAFPDQTWSETVSRVAPAANREEGTNTVSVYISLGSSAPSLRFGQQVDAEIRVFSSKKTIKLPLSALVTRNGKTWIGLIKNNRVHYVPVEIGMEDLTHVEILKGVKPGQDVILPTGEGLQEGDKVHIAAAHPSE